MEFEEKSIKLFKVAKELNIGTGTIVDFLKSKGHIIEKQPNAKIEWNSYLLLLEQFSTDKNLKERSLVEKYEDFRYALKLIEKNIETREVFLDLGKCGLTSEEFIVGSVLDKQLRKCNHLTELILSNEYWLNNDSQPDSPIKIISTNDRYKNYFLSIPACISSLKQLSVFICCGDSDRNWEIKDISVISKNVNLKYLDLSHNQIEDIRSLRLLPSLQHLIIYNNKIRHINIISKLNRLSTLDVHSNKIDSIPILPKEMPLVSLNIGDNKIKNVQGLESLVSLKQLFLYKNEVEDIDGLEPLLLLSDQFYLKINDNPFTNNYRLILMINENHFPFVKEVLQRKQDNSLKSNVTYPVKVLFFGNHSTGKSTLVNFLTTSPENGSTHILRIVNYFLDENKKGVLPDGVFFDFGGQDFYHGIYRAFISENSLQVILFNPKTDYNGIAFDSSSIPIVNFNRKYWLGQKVYQEHHKDSISQFIVIQTFGENNGMEAPPIDYQNYSGYKKSFFLSLGNNYSNMAECEIDFYESGKKYFKAYLDAILPGLQNKVDEPNWYIDFLKYVFDKEGKDHRSTSLDDVLIHYKVKDLEKEKIRESLITNLILLHRHGIVLYYPQIVGLKDIVWLDPQKLVEYIQEEILKKAFADPIQYTTPGVIKKQEFEEIINDEKILLLLKAQNVVFLHSPTTKSENDEYIVPNYLPLVDDEGVDIQLFTFGFEHPSFIIKFDHFIPFGLINQMICFYGKQPDAKKFWRNQLLFTLSKEVRVLIELDFDSLQIRVNFQTLKECVYNENLISEYLFFSIMALYWNLENKEILSFNEFINYKRNKTGELLDISLKLKLWGELNTNSELIPKDAYLSFDNRHFIKYEELFNLSEDEYKIRAYSILNNAIDIHQTKEIAVGPFMPFTHKKLSIMKKIFVSYSKYDEDYLQDFEDHLVTLKQEGVATFNCQKIEFGKEWDEEIKEQIATCDIMICLISVKFLNTDYITKIEIPKAIEQNKMIIPIIIKSCDWESSTLGKYQAAQRGKVVSLDNDRRKWGEIRGITREERDAFWTDIVKELRTKINF